MMVLVSKALQKVNKLNLTGSASDTNKFSDSGSISSYAKAYVATLVKEGIIQGSGSSINPLGTATRAETAVIMYKIINR